MAEITAWTDWGVGADAALKTMSSDVPPCPPLNVPITACTTAMFLFFWRFLQSGARRWFWAAAAAGGATGDPLNRGVGTLILY